MDNLHNTPINQENILLPKRDVYMAIEVKTFAESVKDKVITDGSMVEWANSMYQEAVKDAEEHEGVSDMTQLQEGGQRLNETVTEYVAGRNSVLAGSAISRAVFLDKVIGNLDDTQVESAVVIPLRIKEAINKTLAQLSTQSIDLYIRQGEANDEVFQREFAPGAFVLIHDALETKIMDQGEALGRAIEQPRAIDILNQWTQELLVDTQRQIKDATSGVFGWEWNHTDVSLSEARTIRSHILNTRELQGNNDEIDDMINAARGTGIEEVAIMREAKKKSMEQFADRLASANSAWMNISVAEDTTPEQAANTSAQNLEVAGIHRDILNQLGPNPMVCKLGERVYVTCTSGGERTWFVAELAMLRNPSDSQVDDPKSIFESRTETNGREEFLDDLQSATSMPDELKEQIAIILNDPEQLKEVIGERLTLQQGLDFTADQLSNQQSLIASIDSSLDNVVGNSYRTMINRYRLNFLGNDLIESAISEKKEAILAVISQMDFPSAMAGINAQSREDFDSSNPEGEYPGDHTEFKLMVFEGGRVVRLVPKEAREYEKYRYAGAVQDSIKNKIRQELENPFLGIPVIGGLYAMVSKFKPMKDAFRSFLGPLASKFFGVEVPPEIEGGPEAIDAEIERRTQEQMNAVLPMAEATLYHQASPEDLLSLAQDGISSEETNNKGALILNQDISEFTGTITIPVGQSIRFANNIDIAGAQGYNEETFNNASRIESIYIPRDAQPLTISLDKQNIARYSIIPEGAVIQASEIEQEAPTQEVEAE